MNRLQVSGIPQIFEGIPQEHPGVSGIPQTFGKVSRKSIRVYPVSRKQKVSRKGIPQGYPAKVSRKGIPQRYPAKVSRKGYPAKPMTWSHSVRRLSPGLNRDGAH